MKKYGEAQEFLLRFNNQSTTLLRSKQNCRAVNLCELRELSVNYRQPPLEVNNSSTWQICHLPDRISSFKDAFRTAAELVVLFLGSKVLPTSYLSVSLFKYISNPFTYFLYGSNSFV